MYTFKHVQSAINLLQHTPKSVLQGTKKPSKHGVNLFVYKFIKKHFDNSIIFPNFAKNATRATTLR